jgi:hypothetical protein
MKRRPFIKERNEKGGGRGYKYLKSRYSVTPHNRDSGEAQVVSQETEQSLGSKHPCAMMSPLAPTS